MKSPTDACRGPAGGQVNTVTSQIIASQTRCYKAVCLIPRVLEVSLFFRHPCGKKKVVAVTCCRHPQPEPSKLHGRSVSVKLQCHFLFLAVLVPRHTRAKVNEHDTTISYRKHDERPKGARMIPGRGSRGVRQGPYNVLPGVDRPTPSQTPPGHREHPQGTIRMPAGHRAIKGLKRCDY